MADKCLWFSCTINNSTGEKQYAIVAATSLPDAMRLTVDNTNTPHICEPLTVAHIEQNFLNVVLLDSI